MLFELLNRYCSLDDLPQFAIKQGVAGLLYDEVKAMDDCPFDRRGIGRLLRASEKQKARWEAQRQDIAELDKACSFLGMKMLIFKGYAMSQLYDRPESRKSGDIDVYFFDDKGTCTGDKMDDFARHSDIKVTDGWLHTSFDLGNSHVENHRHFVMSDEHPQLTPIDNYLRQAVHGLAPSSAITPNQAVHGLASSIPPNQAILGLVHSPEWSNVYYPSPDFNAVLLPVHMGGHFVYEGASLHQMIDWETFLRKHANDIDWQTIYTLADQCGYRQWLDVLNTITHDYFHISLSIPMQPSLSASKLADLSSRVMLELADSKPYDRETRASHPLRYLFSRTLMAIHDRWKLRMVFNESTLPWYLRHGWRYLKQE